MKVYKLRQWLDEKYLLSVLLFEALKAEDVLLNYVSDIVKSHHNVFRKHRVLSELNTVLI
jgi:hypothetical protein